MGAPFVTLWNYTNSLVQLIVDPPDTPAGGVSGRLGRVMAYPSPGATPAANAMTSTLLPMFGEADFYDRIHYEFVALALGNLLGNQSRTLFVWNAYRRVRVLEDLTEDGTEGITVTGPGSPPLTWAPLELKTYNVGITIDGPPVIDAVLVFDWDEGKLDNITITGTRVIPWSWAPNWAESLVERLEWRTDVLQAYRGEEQRRAVRRAPRRVIEFAVGEERRARQAMEAAVWGWGGRPWAVPLWFDGADITAEAAAGADTVSVDTATRDFVAGLPAIFIADSRTYETVEILSVEPSSVTLRRPLAATWPAGSRFIPARVGHLEQGMALQRFDGSAAFGRARFALVDGADYTADAGAAVHNGYPVLEVRPNWTAEPSLEFDRKLQILDALVGLVSRDDEGLIPIARQRMRWTFTSRAEIDAWRKRLYAARGRQGAMYVPTWSRDLQPVAPIASSAVAFDVENLGYTLFVQTEPGRRDIRIQLESGAILYRKITGSSVLTADTERINIDASLGVELQPSDIAAISFMALSRFESDAAELAWWTGQSCDASAMTRTFRHDL